MCGFVLFTVIVIRSMCQFVGRETKYEYVSQSLASLPSLLFCSLLFSYSSTEDVETHFFVFLSLLVLCNLNTLMFLDD